MKLWCQICHSLTEHKVTNTHPMDSRDGVTPLSVYAFCDECGRGGTFICNAASMTAVGE